jgi:septal ring factor EnvC (AmiA/AmiB activator)
MSDQQVTEAENSCINCASGWTPEVSADARLIAKYVSSIDEGIGALVNGQRALTEAVRALKPDGSELRAFERVYEMHTNQLRQELAEQRSETERLTRDLAETKHLLEEERALTAATVGDR